jgi:hypothetical protein
MGALDLREGVRVRMQVLSCMGAVANRASKYCRSVSAGVNIGEDIHDEESSDMERGS